MSDIESDNLGEAMPADVADAATSGDGDVEPGIGEDPGTAEESASPPGDQADAVVT